MSTETKSVDLVGEEVAGNVARAALFAALTGGLAYVSFPIPVSSTDFSLQVLGVFLAGIFLGPAWGGASMLLYLVSGAVGAPVFLAGSSGVGVLAGSTGGYLWSYPIAAIVVGLVVHSGLALRSPDRASPVRLIAGMVAGTAIIYALGVGGLMIAGNLGPETAFVQGALVFLPAEAFKVAAAVGIVRSDRIAAE